MVDHLLDAAAVLHADDDAIRRRDADRGGAADAQRPDRLPDLFDVAAIVEDDLGRQQRLIEDAKEPVPRVADPLQHSRHSSHAPPRRMASTCSCKRPLLVTKSGAWMDGVPAQLLNRPPASSTIGLIAATSQACRPCSTMNSPEPWATR